MQEEKKATTPKKQAPAKRRRRRSARSAAPAARSTQAAAQTTSTAEPAAEQNEAAAAPAPAPETAAPSAPETLQAPQTEEAAPQTPEPSEPQTPAEPGEDEPAKASQPAEEKPQEEAEPAADAGDAEPSEPETPEEKTEEKPADETAAASAEETAEAPAAAEAPDAEHPAEPQTPAEPGEAEPAKASQPAEEKPQEEAEPAADAGDAEPSELETPAEPDEASPAEETAAAASAEETAEAPVAAEAPDAEHPAEPQTPAEPGEDKPAEESQPAEEKPQEAAESAADADDAEPAEPDTESPAEPEADEQRVSDITRTVQLSIEQITAHLDAAPAQSETEAAPQSQEETVEEAPPTLADHLVGGLGSIARWLLLVLIFVLVIAISGVVWLYRSATPDMLPQIRVTFAGQEVAPSSYQWKVPVVGKAIRRTYAETLSSAPATLAQPVEQTSPDFTVSPDSYRSELTVTDSEDAVVFEGDVETFANFQFTENGEYTAELTLYSDESPVAGDAAVIGSETWQLSFKVEVRPTVHLFATSVQQGGVAAVTVSDTVDGRPPQIQTTLKNAGFAKAGTGWVCYLPIPWDHAAGTQQLVVTMGDYRETLEFEVQAAKWNYKDYSSTSQFVTPYIGQNDIPAELQNVLGQKVTPAAWAESNFVQPLLNTLDVELYYGMTEYAGRSRSQRASNSGGGRTATNMVLSTTWGELLIAPANGTVALAKDLGEGFGNTLVIDHGAGVRSIFYHLQQIDVKAGDQLKQGQSVATCGSTLVAEMRIGTVPIDPRPVWRAQCDALKHY